MNLESASLDNDQLLWNDWHPVAFAHQIAAGASMPARLLDMEIVVWRDSAGSLQAWEDRCPHRGARLSLGKVIDDHMTCAYHGWRFDAEGRCALRPAQPGGPLPSRPMTRAFHVKERYGVAWVCLGTPSRDVIAYEEFDDPHLRNVCVGPYDVHACAPRVVENFIDMAHLAFVHEGILGDPASAEVPSYEVESFVDGGGETGIRAAGMRVVQPKANVQATGASDVVYGYRISRPISAILTKQIDGSDIVEAIALFVQPMTEEESQVWMIFSGIKSAEPDDAVSGFQDIVFMQDKPILESQRPKRLPLQTRAEVAQRADALSAAYRRYLHDAGMRYGVIR